MGKFFNEVISKMPIIPRGKTKRSTSLEGLRIKFNEEQVPEKPPLYVSDKDKKKMGEKNA